MTGWFCSSRGRGEKCFENGAIQKIVLFAVCSDSAAMADITCIQKYTGDFCPGPGCEVLPQNLINLSGLWMGEECPVPPAPPFPNFRPFLQSFSPGIKLLQGCGGIWAAGAEGIFFFFSNSTPRFCARTSQTLLLLVPMLRETALSWECQPEETTSAMPCLMIEHTVRLETKDFTSVSSYFVFLCLEIGREFFKGLKFSF